MCTDMRTHIHTCVHITHRDKILKAQTNSNNDKFPHLQQLGSLGHSALRNELNRQNGVGLLVPPSYPLGEGTIREGGLRVTRLPSYGAMLYKAKLRGCCEQIKEWPSWRKRLQLY